MNWINKIAVVAVSIVAMLLPHLLLAQPLNEISPPWEWKHLTGDFFDLRPRLESKGIEFQFQYYADFSKNLMGGLNTAGWNYGHLFDATITVDTEKVGLWSGGKFLVNYFCQNGDFASADVGDIQIVDNIDADGRSALYELWYQQTLLDDALRIKIGKIDANIDFDALEFAGDFINSSAGYSPTIVGFPAYPDPAAAAVVFIEPTDRLYLGMGIFDGATQEGINTGTRGPSTFLGSPSDLFLVAEGGVRWTLTADRRAGRAALGLWRHTGTFDRFDGGTDDGTCGFYFLAEQSLWSSGNRELGAFAQYGWADEKVSPIEHHIGMGFSLAGPIDARPDDVVGAMVSIALLSQEPGAGFDERAETAIELFYKAQVFPWLSIQPDVQYIMNPGGVSDVQDALAFIVRVIIDI